MAAAIRKCQKFWEKAHIKQGILQEMVSKITVALRRPILSVRAPPINAKKTCSRKPSERVVPISRLESPIFRI